MSSTRRAFRRSLVLQAILQNLLGSRLHRRSATVAVSSRVSARGNYRGGPMLSRKLIGCCLALALGGCHGVVGTDGTESTADLTKVPASSNPYTLFETLQVRPLAMSPSGKLLFACNTPDNRLEIFRVGSNGQLSSAGSVVVGLEPVAV